MSHGPGQDRPHAQMAAISGPSASPHLRGWRLVAGRIVWLLLFAYFVIPYVVALPAFFTITEHPKDHPALSPGAVAALDHSGISLRTYAWIWLALVVGALVVSVITGMALFWRRGDDWMVLIVSLFVAIHPVGVGSLNILAFDQVSRIGLYRLSWFPVGMLGLVETTLQFGVMLLFPSGRFVPRWSWILLVIIGALTFVSFKPAVSGPFSLIYPLVLVATIASMVYRYRKISTPVQRLQTKWIIFGIAAAPLTSLVFLLPTFFTPLGHTLYAPFFFLVYLFAQLATPVAVFIAVQRFHLYDIDTLINRALVYVSLTAILGGVYAGCVIGAQALVGTFTHASISDQPLVLVATTLLIAALIRPLRRRLQAIIDRLFYRRKYDAARTLAAFSATLRHETDVIALRQLLLSVVAETMQPAHASLWLLPAPSKSKHEEAANTA